jgi:hypothetical protein
MFQEVTCTTGHLEAGMLTPFALLHAALRPNGPRHIRPEGPRPSRRRPPRPPRPGSGPAEPMPVIRWY